MKNIVVGITGSIAAYKIPALIKQLIALNFSVQVVLTKNAQQFVAPLAFQNLDVKGIYTSWTDDPTKTVILHTTLAKWADLIVIAPASANFIAKLTHGLANDLLSTLCLASVAPIFIFPTMNVNMWKNPATQSNVTLLKKRNIEVFDPRYGKQACGDIGLGRMLEIKEIVNHITQLNQKQFLKGFNILITAGATFEPIDPVRFLTNKSSGKMGYALSTQAAILGANVTLISCNSYLPVPPLCKKFITANTASDLLKKVTDAVGNQDIFISCAAVSDYHVANYLPQKIKRTSNEKLVLLLEPNMDILANVAKQYPIFTVGFAAETDQIIKNAKAKLIRKGIDLIIANNVSRRDIGFESDDNEVYIISKTQQTKLKIAPKIDIARSILKFIYHTIFQQ